MNIEERREKILHMIMDYTPISVNDLLVSMEESPATIRRDLSFLEENGYIVRTRGFASYIEPEIVHKITISAEKVAMARCASTMVEDNDTIFLDSGASTLALAQQLVHRSNLTVLTNSLSVANTLSNSNVTVHMTGGFLLGREEALVGPEAEEYISQMTIPKLFLSTTGIRGIEGLACVTPFQASIKRAIIQASQKVILLAKASKFHTDALRIFASFEEIDCIITSAPIDDPILSEHLELLDMEIIVADSPLSGA